MIEIYIALLTANLTVAGIEFAALLALHEMFASAAGEEVSRMVWRLFSVRLSLVLLAGGALLSLAAALAIAVPSDGVPRWDPGADRIAASWLAGLLISSLTVLSIGIAALGIYKASGFTRATRAAASLVATWTLGDISSESVSKSVAAVQEAALRALYRPRLADFGSIVDAANTRLVKLLASTQSDDDRASAITAYRERFLMPLAEEADMAGRPDQIAIVSSSGPRLVLGLSDLGLGSRTQALVICERAMELLLARADARRALTLVIEDIYQLASASISARSLEGFEDACAAWLPVAKSKPGRYLVRSGRVDVGLGDDPARPIERLVELLDHVREGMWGRNGPDFRHPKVWAEVVDAAVMSLIGWYKELKPANRDAEDLIVRLVQSPATLATDMAKRGRGDQGSYALDPISHAARASRIGFEELPRDCARWLAQIGLTAEAGSVRCSGGDLAAEVATLILESIPMEIAPLLREVQTRAEYSHFDAAVRNKFIARLTRGSA